MKTLLVLAAHPEIADQLRAALSPDAFRILHRLDFEEAEPILHEHMVDACIIDADPPHVQSFWAVEKMRRRLPRTPLLVVTPAAGWEWEEESYVQGVSHVVTKPIKARVMETLLNRAWASPVPATKSSLPVAISGGSRTSSGVAPRPENSGNHVRTLEVLRDFSAILTHSLCAEALLKQFLLLLREIVGVNRAAVFLRQPASIYGKAPAQDDRRSLRSACAIGLSPGLLEHFELSFEAGIGGFLFRHGRILRRYSEEAQDPEMQKEFELLGAQVAIPILDRETLVGVAAFDGRVTGEVLSNHELELIFHLLEELSLAVKNIWLHDQLSVNHEMLADILRQLSSGCVVISRELKILHANRTARKYFARRGQRSEEFDFTDLPHALGSKIYQALKTGTGIAPFKYSPTDAPQTIFHISIIPFQGQDNLPTSALLLVEDHTQTEQLRRLEIETNNLRLIKSMADRLAHEIGNAMVPLSTHQQLLSSKFKDAEFRASLDTAMADGVKRVTRLINQMRFLARDSVASHEAFPVSQLIEEAYLEAQKHHQLPAPKLEYPKTQPPLFLSGDRAALRHALAEVILNAMQANPSDPRVDIKAQTEILPNGTLNGQAQTPAGVQIEVRDNGRGFTEGAAAKASEPFFTTRNVGLGLGMTVCRKIIETHQGRLEIVDGKPGQAGVVRISLPYDGTADAKLAPNSTN